MLSCQYSQNVIDGKKNIILNPGEQQRKDVPPIAFAEGEVWGIDVLVVSSADGKVSFTLFTDIFGASYHSKSRAEDSRSTIYQRVSDVNYQLKMNLVRLKKSEKGEHGRNNKKSKPEIKNKEDSRINKEKVGMLIFNNLISRLVFDVNIVNDLISYKYTIRISEERKKE